MNRHSFLVLVLWFIGLSCNEPYDPVTLEPGETTESGYIKTIDFSSSLNNISEIQDFDVENGQLYFIYDQGIYKMDLNLNTNNADLIIADNSDWPQTLKVINNTLYYQGDTWATTQDIKQIDLNNLAAGVQLRHTIIGASRSQFCKNYDKLYYLSSTDGLSPINNFYKLNPSSKDQLIATDQFIHPQNMRVRDNYLYFSSLKEVRRFDLNNPNEPSSLVYTVPDLGNNTSNDGEILGFDIKDDIIYFTQISNNKLLAKDLNKQNEAPIILKINGDKGTTGYGKLIIANDKLIAKRIIDKQIEVFAI